MELKFVYQPEGIFCMDSIFLIKSSGQHKSCQLISLNKVSNQKTRLAGPLLFNKQNKVALVKLISAEKNTFILSILDKKI